MDFDNAYILCAMHITLIGVSLCNEFSLGDQFEINDLPMVQDPLSMVPDLAIPGNILIWTNAGQLYTTDMKTTVELTTESELNITYMQSFVQTTPDDIVYVKRIMRNQNIELCHCHFSRVDKVARTLDDFDCEYVCEQSVHRNNDLDGDSGDIIVTLDDRNKDFVYSIRHESARLATVIFYNLSKNYRYSNRKQLRMNSTLRVLNSPDNATTYAHYTINHTLTGVNRINTRTQSIAQDGDVCYLLYAHIIYRLTMPPISSLVPGSNIELSVLWITGSNIRGFADGSFTDTQFAALNDIARINSTMLAVTDYFSNQIRLIDLRTNTTSSPCWKGPYNADANQTPTSCPLIHADTLLFMNNSLYVEFLGGFGRIYHSKELSEMVIQAENNSNGLTTIISVSLPVTLLVISSGVVISVLVWRRRHNHLETRSTPDRSQKEGNLCEMINRPLPVTSDSEEITIGEEEIYDMPELEQEDVYDMIGDQDYDTISPQISPQTDTQGTADPQNITDSRHHTVSIYVGQHHSSSCNDVSDSNLDRYGYLRPNVSNNQS